MAKFTKTDREQATLESLKEKYLAIYDQKNAEMKNYQEKAETAKKRKIEAMEKAEQAYKNANTEEFHKWQDQIRLNDDAMKMYTDKASAIEKEPYITRAQFDEICKGVEKDFDLFVEQDRENLASIAKSMIAIRDRELERMIEANEFLKFAQLTLLKATNGLWKNGMLETFNIKELKNYAGLDFVRFVCRHSFIESFIEK